MQDLPVTIRPPSSSQLQLRPRLVLGALGAPLVRGLLLRTSHLSWVVAAVAAPTYLQSAVQKIWTSSLVMRLWQRVPALATVSTTPSAMVRLRTGTIWSDSGQTRFSNTSVLSLKTTTSS
jgi:hypothetical protein